jgi:formylmethanofuran dehydrogenase subunit E
VNENDVRNKDKAGAAIGPYTFEEYVEVCRRFHHYPAPGLLLGGFMVDAAMRRLPEGALFDAVSETSWCLPDAIQILTPCTIGNGWLKVFNLGLFGLTLYDKTDGRGVRVALDPSKLDDYPEIAEWIFKLKPKKEQDSDALRDAIRRAGADVCSIREVRVRREHREGRGKGEVAPCPVCGEAYPVRDGGVCRLCRGESPYEGALGGGAGRHMDADGPRLNAVPVERAVGKRTLHDMTGIVPGESKGPEFKRGATIEAGDLCRLQQIGRARVYLDEGEAPGDEWVHEDDAAAAFAEAMAGEGAAPAEKAREGKVEIKAERDGLFVADLERLERFNLAPGVMAACRKSFGRVERGGGLAGTRAIPLYLSRERFDAAMRELDEPVFRVLPFGKARVGLLITGNEVFYGHIEDKFEAVVSGKVLEYGCEVAGTEIVPDDREAVRKGVEKLLAAGAELIITTAGLSVDPDDVTRQGLADAGATDMLYGAPVLPGAMTLLARIGETRIIGVPACALFFKTTSLDLVLPRVLAGVEITRADLARLANGGYCLGCKVCTWPKCSFGT